MLNRSNRPIAAVLTTLLVVATAPLMMSGSPASAEPDHAPGFTRIAPGIPSAEVALKRAKALFSQQAHGRDLTLTLRDLQARLPELTGDDRLFAKQLLARPNGGKTGTEQDIGALWPHNEAASSPECSLLVPVCVHWTARSKHQPPDVDDDVNGVPDQVDRTLSVMENVWDVEINDLGYRAPLTDERASIDDDGVNFDVYLSDIGDDGYYGYCTIDDSRNFNNYNFYDRSGYCVVDNDFAPSQFPFNTPLQNLQVTAAHEFFHAIQFAYDTYEDRWFMEGSAAWVEDEVYDAVNDNRQYLQLSQLRHPDRPLDRSVGFAVYGSWIYFRYLSERFDPNIVRTSWNRADGSPTGPDDYSLRGVRKAIELQGANFRSVFADYARANIAPQEFYAEGAAYPSPSFDVKGLGGNNKTTGWINTRIDHMSTFYQGAKPNSDARAHARVHVKVDAPNRVTGSQARVLVHYDNGSYATSRVDLNRDGNGAVTVDFGRGEVRRISVALINASDRFAKCFRYNTQFSCGGGVPVDENRPYAVKVTLA